MSFASSLQFGQVGESAIAKWMRRRGWFVLPIYEKEISQGKGPQLFTPLSMLIGTDMLIFRGNDTRWTTGIDLRHYEDYCRIDDETPWPVWLLFLHRAGRAKDTPADMESPVGLFGNTLAYLREHENHRHENWGKSGMVYWAKEHLRELASLDEVLSTQ